MRRKIAFYPCCEFDVVEPLRLLSPFVDEVIFCDLKAAVATRGSKAARASNRVVTFITGDVRQVLMLVPQIDVLFYRRDSEGEGGSRIFILGDSVLPMILGRFNPAGGLIITDGSNSRGGNFRKMCSPRGLRKDNWLLKAPDDQPLFKQHGLKMVTVSPISDATE